VPPTYLTNDDVGIKRDLEGLTAPGAAPTGYLLMAHSILGWALVWMHRIVATHEWDLVVAGLLICSIAVLLTDAWSLFQTSLDRSLTLALLIASIAPLLAGLQFTISATIAGIAAMTTVLTELLWPSPRRAVLGAAGTLLFIALLVRPMGATAGAVLTTALLVPLAVFDGQFRRVRMRRMAAAAMLVAAGAALLVCVDDAVYRMSPAWNEYHQDNWMLARFFEWGGDVPTNVVEALRKQVGWSANDWELLRRFWGIDPSIHSHERIDMLYRAWSAVVDWRLRAQSLMQRTAEETTGATFLRLFAESRIALTVTALIAFAYASWDGLAAAVGSIVIFLVVSMGIEVGFKELPIRLFAPLQAGLVVAVLITCRTWSRQPKRWLLAMCAAAAIVLMVHQVRQVAADAIADSRQSRETDAQVLDLLQLHPSLLVLHADSFPSEHWWRPFHTPPVQLQALQLGMNNHNPYVQRFIDRRYRESLLHAICADPSVVIIAERGRLDPVTSFMKEHYATDVEWKQVYAGSFRAWHCSPASGT
jgi:hypothetical protein